jgi:hypothetical protein
MVPTGTDSVTTSDVPSVGSETRTLHRRAKRGGHVASRCYYFGSAVQFWSGFKATGGRVMPFALAVASASSRVRRTNINSPTRLGWKKLTILPDIQYIAMANAR